MTDKLMECITNPVKCKLLLEIYSQGQATAKHLSDKYTDIPPATLYRHLKRMLHDGILKVVEETQVRGTVERTYALAQNINSNMEKYWKKTPANFICNILCSISWALPDNFNSTASPQI